jgi:hypothetical protein
LLAILFHLKNALQNDELVFTETLAAIEGKQIEMFEKRAKQGESCTHRKSTGNLSQLEIAAKAPLPQRNS